MLIVFVNALLFFACTVITCIFFRLRKFQSRTCFVGIKIDFFS